MLNIVSRIDNTYQPYLYRGEDYMKKFVKQLTEIKKNIFEKINVNKLMDKLIYDQKQNLETQPIALYIIKNST